MLHFLMRAWYILWYMLVRNSIEAMSHINTYHATSTWRVGTAASFEVLMALKKALEGLMGSKTVAQLRIQEHNEQVHNGRFS